MSHIRCKTSRKGGLVPIFHKKVSKLFDVKSCLKVGMDVEPEVKKCQHIFFEYMRGKACEIRTNWIFGIDRYSPPHYVI